MPEAVVRSRRRSLRAVLISLLFIAVAFAAIELVWSPVRKAFPLLGVRVPKLQRAATTIVPGIHMLGGLSPSAAYVIETPQGLVLIDSGLDRDARGLRAQMTELGLDWRNVIAVFLTHVHGDHSGGAEFLRTAVGAKVYAGADDVPCLAEGGPRAAFFSTFYMPNESIHATKVDVPLRGAESFTFGESRIHVVATPGHTPGSTCYLLERGRLRAFFGGDIIMMLRGDTPPRSELRKPLGTYSAYLAPRYRGDARDFLETLRRLRAMPVPDLVLPGHPRADPEPQSPCLSQSRWASLMDGGIQDLELLMRRYTEDGADFLDGVPKKILPDFFYFGDIEGSPVYGFLASSKFYLIDAPGGPGLGEFLKTRQRELGLEPVPPAAVLLTSCGRSETAGLRDLIEKDHVQVVAAERGIESLKAICPAGTTIVPAENLPALGWFEVAPIPLAGRGSAPMAYLLTHGEKRVLVSGRIPVKMSQEEVLVLHSALGASRERVAEYTRSLEVLRQLKPDLWLPGSPVDCQNANIYDDEWAIVLEENLQVVREIASRAK